VEQVHGEGNPFCKLEALRWSLTVMESVDIRIPFRAVGDIEIDLHRVQSLCPCHAISAAHIDRSALAGHGVTSAQTRNNWSNKVISAIDNALSEGIYESH
jgi:hypothetical protein